jgi:hypothetical protein
MTMNQADPPDDILQYCNATELLELARQQGLGRLKRDLPLSELVAIVSGDRAAKAGDMSGTTYTRSRLEQVIGGPDPSINRAAGANWWSVRSQLPGCNGLCTKYKCTEGRHALCCLPNVDSLTAGP